MDSATEASKILSKSPSGFIKHMTNFDEDTKCQLLNMFQYSILSIIPVILILKAVRNFVPIEDDSKGTIEITAECIAQIALIIVTIWFSNRAIMYIPTYSGCEYTKFDAISFLLPFILILVTMQTKLGAKINILIDRAMDLWNGKKEYAVQPKTQVKVNVTQPISGQHQPSQADYLDQSQLLPSMPGMTGLPQQAPPQQKDPDFNQMYNTQSTPMPGAANPNIGYEGFNDGPMAANASLGGSFSNW